MNFDSKDIEEIQHAIDMLDTYGIDSVGLRLVLSKAMKSFTPVYDLCSVKPETYNTDNTCIITEE